MFMLGIADDNVGTAAFLLAANAVPAEGETVNFPPGMTIGSSTAGTVVTVDWSPTVLQVEGLTVPGIQPTVRLSLM